ncbi:MAG: hypothetical protein E7589_07030 [Ruminococcaceae bacterium]|nr:hypothetical protein [Oscillospiraceae bacterium]
MSDIKIRNKGISVSREAVSSVLGAFSYSKSLLQVEISALSGVGEMTVSRAVRLLKSEGVLDAKEEVDGCGLNKRHTVYPRDVASMLVLDLSGATFRAVLLDTSLSYLSELEHIYNPTLDFEDNLRKFLNLAQINGLIEKWKAREVIHTLPYSPRRRERMRRSRAKRIAALVARMKRSFSPIVRLGLILPDGETGNSLPVCLPPKARINKTVGEILERDADALLSAREAFLIGAPSVIASCSSVATLANARSMLLLGGDALFGDCHYLVLLCRKEARAHWGLPDGAAKSLAITALKQGVAIDKSLRRLTAFFEPDIVAVDKCLKAKVDVNAVSWSDREAVTVGAAILLRDSAWREYREMEN